MDLTPSQQDEVRNSILARLEIIHLDIGVPMLSPAFYYYLVFKDIEKASEYCSVEDVPEYEISNWINH